ncbi:MAG: type II toxin-antitoxin system prevent-host-death family antitoxin [Chloroflexota bacterium]|nr:MAG: type II toxin-antitoxin system prevent-host-death family antitoxin [Chloroflexota bacterium]
MLSLGVREFREQLSQVLQRVREEGEVVEITYHGRAIARLVPAAPAAPSAEEVEAILSDLDSLAAEIGRQWQGETSALEAVHEVRREL